MPQLLSQEWEGLFKRLVDYAQRLYRGSLDSRNLAQETITQALAGRRRWNHRYDPFQNLSLMLRSIGSNELRKRRREVQLDSVLNVNLRPSLSLPCICAVSATPAERLEATVKASLLPDSLTGALTSDSLSELITGCVMTTEYWKSRDIAAELHIPVLEVYQWKRRMRRKLGFRSVKKSK